MHTTNAYAYNSVTQENNNKNQTVNKKQQSINNWSWHIPEITTTYYILSNNVRTMKLERVICNWGNNNNNNQDNVYGAVIMAEPLWEFTRFIWWMQNGTKRAPTQDQARRLRLYRLPESTPTIAIYYYYSYRPTDGRRLSRPSWLLPV